MSCGQPVEKRHGDVLLVGLLVAATIGVQIALRARIDRPLWYDELWRPHFAGEPWPTFWSELTAANTPSSVGSLALTRLTGTILGWHSWSLRLVGAGIWLPLLATGGFLLARRFTGRVPAVAATVTTALAGTVVDTGTQLKPYVLDAVVTLAVVALWTGQATLPRRTAAGALALLSLPAVFLLVPLAGYDLVRAVPRRTVVRTAGRVGPALLLTGTHMMIFVAHQSSQRASHFWDDHFLAGRGILGGLRFTLEQTGAILGGVPPGIDRYDPNLVHSLLEGHRLPTLLVGTATAVALALGVRVLRRRPDGMILIVALVGAELLQLAASAGRYWPFGACRTNLFLVPLLTIIVAVGVADLARTAQTARLVGPARLPAAVGLIALAVMPVCAVGGTVTLWDERHDPRPIEAMVDATIAARAEYRAGDLVIVGGRLARAGWLYAMDLSDDASSGEPPVGPRVPRSATTFLSVIGKDGADGADSAIRSRPQPPNRILLFILAYDLRGTAAELASLRQAGWCEQEIRTFPLTGTLHGLTRCAPTPRGDSRSPSAVR
ncbi:hypothetical protein ThrDRAFT_00064 [Frankia casuarinae]|uniref:Glycosyltransferase RgtA/B/C/D-like domain-containing protein n=1 Tax=Frankia casuarinae (strain DSM 45818 / CECT 9043 / HFP020203 / CcI3) TaxID=106370 RepID=Q2JGY5_FRACC|nr:hypothetical protein Francci3_0063 [Frankia casuarinae]EYT94140.1 hypothetical protein ThrDRAFT_00064 [Frankia casuarinae]